MTRFLFPSLALCVALFANQAAYADDADIDVPGPTGRSSIVAYGAYSRNQQDFVSSTGTKLGESDWKYRGLMLVGTLALHERVSIELSGSRGLSNGSFNYQGSSSDSSGALNAGSLGISVRPVGNPTDDGFGLVVAARAGHAEGFDSGYDGYLQPQYRFNGNWLTYVTLGQSKTDDFRNRFVDVALLWKALPNLSVINALSWQRGEHDDDASPKPRYTSFNLDVNYHLDRNLSFLSSVYVGRTSDIDSPGYLRTDNDRDYGLRLGVRWTF